MPYVASDGSMVQQKPFGISVIMDYFWGTVNVVSFFFRSLFHMDDPRPARGQYGNAGRAPGVPGRRMGGIRHSGGAASAPPCVGGG